MDCCDIRLVSCTITITTVASDPRSTWCPDLDRILQFAHSDACRSATEISFAQMWLLMELTCIYFGRCPEYLDLRRGSNAAIHYKSGRHSELYQSTELIQPPCAVPLLVLQCSAQQEPDEPAILATFVSSTAVAPRRICHYQCSPAAAPTATHAFKQDGIRRSPAKIPPTTKYAANSPVTLSPARF